MESKFTIAERINIKLRRLLSLQNHQLTLKTREYFLSKISDFNPGVLHAHFGPSALSILPLVRQLEIPLVTTFHGYDASSYLRNPRYLKLLQDLYSYSYIITVSEEMKVRLIESGADETKITCLYVGVPVDLFKYILRTPICVKFSAGEEIKFLQVSNFVEKKGHEYTLLAFREFLKFYVKAKLIFAGDGPLFDYVVNLADKLGLTSHVEFHGHQPSSFVAVLMKSSDCFLHHSVTAENGETEGIPTVIMEAMATGLPVISTIHAGIPELICHAQNGLIVPERDIEEYASVMKCVLNDDGTLGLAARKTILDKFNLRTSAQELIDMYNKLSR